ncbi:MAG: hypothetical protein J6584_03075 [Lactobacillus sp.]|uniref:hypothetical protein n=1 Tax=Bombilactobacillus bombi TaxID=1303590 RepID=UPI0035F0D0E8|nr:hypothetical protein [Lactobacillus sp.]
MQRIFKLYLKREGIGKIGTYLAIILLSATLITLIIVQGLAKDEKLGEILPMIFQRSPKVQGIVNFYIFEILFIRAGVMLLQGFLALQIIASTFVNRQIVQLAAAPMTRAKIYYGMIAVIGFITGIILMFTHGVGLLLICWYLHVFKFNGFILLLIKDWFLDILFISASLFSCAIAMVIKKAGYIISTSIGLIIILCNMAVASYSSESNYLLFIILVITTIISCLGNLLAQQYFNKQDI